MPEQNPENTHSVCQSSAKGRIHTVCHGDGDSLIPPKKTALTFFSLPVLFLFAHAAGVIRLRVVVF